MSDRVYRTANGKSLDFGALTLKQENVTAVGNMKGDKKKKMVGDKKPEEARHGRLLKNKEHNSQKLYMREVPPSPTIKKLIELAEKELINMPVLPMLPEIDSIDDQPQEISLQDVDFSTINVDEQIEALADQMLDSISDMEKEELLAIEMEDEIDESIENLSGLAAAMARARESK